MIPHTGITPEVRAEMERLEEEEFRKILNPTLPAIHYARQFLLDLLRELKTEAFRIEESNRSDHAAPFFDRLSSRFRTLIGERSGYLIEMTKTVYLMVDDPAQAIQDIREPKRMALQEEQAKAVAASKRKVLEKELLNEMSEKRDAFLKELEDHAAAKAQELIKEGRA